MNDISMLSFTYAAAYANDNLLKKLKSLTQSIHLAGYLYA